MTNHLSDMPSVHEVLADESFAAACAHLAHAFRAQLVRETLGRIRSALPTAPPDPGRTPVTRAQHIQTCVRAAHDLWTQFPRRVINGTGILIHTNLGRAPLNLPSAFEAYQLDRYTNIEWNAETNSRGDRCAAVELRLRLLTGAEAALVVNNCAAALLLALATEAKNRDVLISRSELVEIGGGFRIPDVMEFSGCRLLEVGTTNKTRLSDFTERANHDSVLLKVHQSNFSMTGFVETVGIDELVSLGRQLKIPVIEDNGSGQLFGDGALAISGEPNVRASVSKGVDAVCFSGDKLMGGIQAGFVVGKATTLNRMKRHPLYRAFRIDKMRIAMTRQLLDEYLTSGFEQIPIWNLKLQSIETLESRLHEIARDIESPIWDRLRIVALESTMGGGSNPSKTFQSVGLELRHRNLSAMAVQRALNAWSTPIVGFIRNDSYFLDARALFEDDFDELKAALAALVASTGDRT